MPTGLNTLAIWNRALDLVGQYPLASLVDDNPYARWLARNYNAEVRAELEANAWGFACVSHVLSAHADAPLFRWSHKYALPAGWLKVLPLTEGGARGGATVPYEVKDGWLFVNDAGPINVEIVTDHLDPTEWTGLFADLITARMAYGLALKFTKNPRVLATVQTALKTAEARADDANAREGDPNPVEQHDIVRVRY